MVRRLSRMVRRVDDEASKADPSVTLLKFEFCNLISNLEAYKTVATFSKFGFSVEASNNRTNDF